MLNQVITVLSFSDDVNLMEVDNILTNKDGNFRLQDHLPAPHETGDSSAEANWRLKNWGCQFDVEPRDAYFIPGGLLVFCTKASHPRAALVQISNRFPDSIITVQYASDLLGADQGDYELKNGMVMNSMDLGDGLDFAEFLWSEYGGD
ncbi:hypothetical protein [Reinekea sp.]|jgi:hypothetical protein|uniref:hypothetical protein n=1 Tax=Reinekea sp. TaxID=1970455 RepID=UPI002A7FBFB8|nr:hypothetical protein [Reinekea sp.]